MMTRQIERCDREDRVEEELRVTLALRDMYARWDREYAQDAADGLPSEGGPTGIGAEELDGLGYTIDRNTRLLRARTLLARIPEFAGRDRGECVATVAGWARHRGYSIGWTGTYKKVDNKEQTLIWETVGGEDGGGDGGNAHHWIKFEFGTVGDGVEVSSHIELL